MKNSQKKKAVSVWATVLLIILIGFISFTEVKATSYYFSTINGNDGNSGTSSASPWKTISKMQSVINSIQPGDYIYLERGSVWYQTQLEFLNKKGTSGSPIRIKPYGKGAMPVLSGEKILTGATKTGNIYSFNDNDLPEVSLTSQSYGRRFLGSVTINGKHFATSREPNGDNYYLSTSTSGTGLTDDISWSTNQWQTGFMAVKNVKWQWSVARVNSNTANSLTTSQHITTSSIFNPGGPLYYYFLNAYNAMDLNGEWYFNDNHLSIYWNGTLGEVKASIVDVVLIINGSDHIYFDSISVKGANFYGAKISKGDYNRFNHCKFSGIGELGVYIFGKWEAPPSPGDSENNSITNCEFSDVLLCSIYSRYSRGGIITNNYIHRNALDEAYHNLKQDDEPNPNHGFAIAMFNNLGLYPQVKQNFIDSTAAGIITHYNPYTINIRENFIRNYGMTERADLGGFYLVSDSYSNAYKLFKKNFLLDVHMPKGTMENTYSDSYTHALYFDQDSYAVKGDSNSIENADAALYTNGGKFRSFKYNNIVNPNIHNMHPNHRATIIHSYNIALANGTKAESDTILGNTIVFGGNSEMGYRFSRVSSSYGATFPINSREDYNKYFDPKSTSPTVATIYDQYNPQYTYNMSGWQNASFTYDSKTYTPGDHSSYNNTAYNSVKLFKNFSSKSKSFPLNAQYVNTNGAVVSGSITVPPFYSVILFCTGGNSTLDKDVFIDTTLVPALGNGELVVITEPENQQPTLQAAQFEVNEAAVVPYLIGTLSASDPDAGQTLTYSIVSGNTGGLFTVTSDGQLKFTTTTINFTNNPVYNLSIKVTDNGSPVLTSTNTIKVNLIANVVVEEPVNHQPTLQSSQFEVNESASVPLLIGNLVASDPDENQSINYTIVSGNSNGLFSITSSGQLKFTTTSLNFTNNPVYNLSVKVTDNGSPVMSTTNNIQVSLIAEIVVEEPVNNEPEISPQSFNTNYEVSLPIVLGEVEATDPDADQSLAYSIESGNEDGIFSIDPSTGKIEITSLPENQETTSYILIVKVADDAEESLSAESTVTVYVNSSSLIYYIDPDNTEDTKADGSQNHPFSTWSKVTWKENASYVQKRGTIASESKILITAKNVTLGDYGSGEAPIIKSSATDYAVKAQDKSDITIKNINIKADDAIGCIYFIGAECQNNSIENCRLEGADYGLRIIDGKSYTVKYNVFLNEVDGIYSIADYAEIYYNVFKGNHVAINLSSYSADAKIYNNVFYDNRQGVSSSYAEVLLFNNIFYLTNTGDQAINHKLDKLVSDHNIFYPEQQGFIEIQENKYSQLSDFQADYGLDIASLAKDPLFMDIYHENFGVEPQSNAIDAGKTVGLTQDFIGHLVPFGGAPDIGLIEATQKSNNGITALAANTSKTGFSVYPNPSNGKVNLKLEGKTSSNILLTVSGIDGKNIIKENYASNNGFNKEINLEDAPKGLYFVTIKASDATYTEKLIIQ